MCSRLPHTLGYRQQDQHCPRDRFGALAPPARGSTLSDHAALSINILISRHPSLPLRRGHGGMGVPKPRQVRFATLLVLLLLALLLVVNDCRSGWGWAWRTRDRLAALIFLRPTEPGARSQLLQHLLIAQPPAAFRTPSLKEAPLLALYVFSTSNVAGYMRRQLIRRQSPLKRLPEEYQPLVQLRFVIGQPVTPTKLLWTLPEDLSAEQDEHEDLVFIDEDVDGGKSLAWMRAVGQGEPAQWVFKAGDDVSVSSQTFLTIDRREPAQRTR